jgi:hypothetical protein
MPLAASCLHGGVRTQLVEALSAMGVGNVCIRVPLVPNTWLSLVTAGRLYLQPDGSFPLLPATICVESVNRVEGKEEYEDDSASSVGYGDVRRAGSIDRGR